VGSKGEIGEAQRRGFLLDEPGRLKTRDHKGLGSIERSGEILSHFEKTATSCSMYFRGLER